MKHPCYTTKTGIRIGCYYEPPLRQLSFEEERIQLALLSKRRPGFPWGFWVLVGLGVGALIPWVTR